jgi:hypothetical protein
MCYAAFLLVFLGEVAVRALFGLDADHLAAFGHGVAAGLVVLLFDFIAYGLRQFRRS